MLCNLGFLTNQDPPGKHLLSSPYTGPEKGNDAPPPPALPKRRPGFRGASACLVLEPRSRAERILGRGLSRPLVAIVART